MKFSWKETVSAFSEIYEFDIKEQVSKQKNKLLLNSSSNPITREYFSRSKYINEIIRDSGIQIDKLDPIIRNIIRTFVSTVLLGEDIPLAVSRAIRISEKFSSPKSYKFIHATISKIMSNLNKNS